MNAKSMMLSVSIAAAGLFSASAHADLFPDFKVDPTATGSAVGTFTADKITGNYVEVITFGAGTFNISLLWQPTGFSFPDGVFDVPDTGLGSSYALYATFQGSGTFTTNGVTSSFTLTPGGTFEFYRDAKSGAGTTTTFTLPGNGTLPFGKTLGSDGADMLLATGSGVAGDGNLTCGVGINCGSFGQVSTFNLTADGLKFFVDPVPFYNIALTAGQFNGFVPSPGATLVLNGSLDGVFTNNVPEPATLALVGLSLIGLAASRRRRA
jgi:hypothetical protein